MKKYAILTSILALCACGGGGGGGIGTAGSDVTTPRAAVSTDGKASNSNVTSMASEVFVPQGGGTPILNRSGTVRMGGVTYNSYRLDDVNFRVATGANDAHLRFHMDDVDGKIDSLVMNVGGITGNQHMDRRNDDTADFRGIVYEYVLLDSTDDQHMGDIMLDDDDTLVRLVVAPSNDITDYSVLQNAANNKCPENKSCRWDRIDQAFRITSLGDTGDDDTNFKYSDFGKLQTTNFGKYQGITDQNSLDASKTGTRTTDGGNIVNGDYKNWNAIAFSDSDYDVFAGGYNGVLEKRPTTTTTFTGKAVGSLYATDSLHHSGEGLPLTDNGATLEVTVDSNKNITSEELTMHFGNWYDVTVTKDGDSTSPRIKFDNYSNSDTTHYADGYEHVAANTLQNYLKFRTAEDTDGAIIVDNFTTTQGSVEDPGDIKTEGLLDMRYYGLSTTEEATGVVRFKETSNVDGIQHEREFRAGYGMKPDAE